MEDWYPEGLPKGTLIIPSENGFTSDQIAIQYLQHYIDNSDAGPEADWKLMLMDNHGSHCTAEFIALANANHIRPYPLIAHLTHCMQPLDVGVFQPYKHWHDIAIQDAIAEFSVEYTLRRFLGDLTKIRENTFKRTTIQHAFEKSGMWPPNTTNCLTQLKTFNPDLRKKKSSPEDEPTLPILPRINPTTPIDVEVGLQEWQRKIQKGIEWSDPVREEEFDSFVNNSKQVCTQATFTSVELSIHQKRRQDDLERSTSRKRLKKPIGSGLGLTKEQADQMIAQKMMKEKEIQEKKEHGTFMKLWRMERDTKHAEGVIARKQEKARIRRVKELMGQGLTIAPELLTPIPDPEVIWKSSDVTWQAEEEAKRKRKEAKERGNTIAEADDEEVTFIIDSTGDPISSQQDFLPFNFKASDDRRFQASDSDHVEESDDDVQEQLGYY
jgi:DDE superfamily endonuclease